MAPFRASAGQGLDADLLATGQGGRCESHSRDRRTRLPRPQPAARVHEQRRLLAEVDVDSTATTSTRRSRHEKIDRAPSRADRSHRQPHRQRGADAMGRRDRAGKVRPFRVGWTPVCVNVQWMCPNVSPYRLSAISPTMSGGVTENGRVHSCFNIVSCHIIDITCVFIPSSTQVMSSGRMSCVSFEHLKFRLHGRNS